jgi:hypothetical protein
MEFSMLNELNKNELNEYLLTMDMELIANYKTVNTVQLRKDYLTDKLYKIYSNFFKFIKTDDDAYVFELKLIFLEMLTYILVESHNGELQDMAKKTYELKNRLRGFSWYKVGLFGQVAEIHAKCERLMTGLPDDEDTIYDAWIDLYNYCKFAVACIHYKFYIPEYAL